MRNKPFLFLFVFLLAIILCSCVRPSTTSPASVPTQASTLPNPVSTQSQLMKDIIAGTQTAMAIAAGADTPAPTVEGEEQTPAAQTQSTTATNTPAATSALSLPTSTPGPAPVVELNFNNKVCDPGYYICVVSYKKDQTVTVQVSHPYVGKDMDLEFKMGQDGNYDFGSYIVAGTATYAPTGESGYNFQVTLNIPDSLRGTPIIIVRMEAVGTTVWGMDNFENK